MKQGPAEKVRDFWTKVQLHMDRVKDSVDVQEQVDTLDKVDFDAAIQGDVRKECNSASQVTHDFYEKQIFIAGLSADVRMKVMEATPRTAYDALQVAIETETLILDKKDTLKMPIKISVVQATKDYAEEEPEDDDDDAESALAVLNAIRIQRGKQPFKKFPGGYPKSNGNETERTTELAPKRRTGNQ